METHSKLFFQLTFPAGAKNLAFDLLFCIVVTSLAIFAGLRATTSGPGISPDSVSYISVGANIYHGNGFVSDLANAFDTSARVPLTIWPPGYSLLIAGLMVFGLSAVEAANLATILCFALLLGVVYWLAKNMAGRVVGILSCVTVLALMPVLRAATFALSEIPFVLFSTLAVAGFVQYAKTDPERRWGWLILSAVGTSLAVLTRYVGLLWIPAGLLVLSLFMFEGRGKVSVSIANRLRQIILQAGAFTLISILPIIPWIIRNVIITGRPAGFSRMNGYHPSFLENVRYAFSTLAGELIPSIHIGLRSMLSLGNKVGVLAVLLILLLFAGLAVTALRGEKQRLSGVNAKRVLFDTFQDFMMWLIPILYSVLYLAGMLVLASLVQFPAYDWPRTLVVIYPLIIIVFLGSWAYILRMFFRSSSILSRELLTVLPALFLILPYTVQSIGFITLASQGQELSTRAWRDNQGIRFLLSKASQQDEIFSDQPAGVSYVLNRPVRYLPYTSEFDQFLKLIMSPKSGAFYIIIFKGDLGQPDPYLPPRLSTADLQRLAATYPDMKVVADFPDSTVYRVY